ncbi:MAG: hypothetical protein WCV86_04900 [Patescibacteria group bacterium]|jgi:hypothetical protein
MLTIPLLSGCSEDHAQVIAPPQEQTAPSVPDQYAQYEAQGTLIQQWIDRMDPYVTQNADGTFVCDWQAFQQDLARTNPQIALALNGAATPGKDAKVIVELRDGIPIANKALKEQPEGMTQTASTRCYWRWWGRTCCYTGWDAEVAVWTNAAAAVVAGIAGGPIGAGVVAYIAWVAERLTDQCGGFCINATWVGGFWLTCP